MKYETIKPGMKGSIELLNHAAGHLELGNSFDNKIAMISTDVAVESMIKSYLSLPSSITNQKRISKDELEKIYQNFHTLLEGLKQKASHKIPHSDDLKEIEYFHSLRNSLYHSGEDITVDEKQVETYLEIAKNLFSNLFDISIDNFIEPKSSSSIGEFFVLWREIKPIMEELVEKLEIKHGVFMEPRYYVMQRLISRKLIDPSYKEIYKELRDFRHEITHGFKKISEKEVKFYISRLKEFLKILDKINTQL